MPTAPTEEQLALAAWFVQHKRRWPLVLVLTIGLVTAIAILVNGLIVATSQTRVPRSKADVMALKRRPSIPASENAAPKWDHAEYCLLSWGGDTNADPLNGTGMEWDNPSTYAPDSQLYAFYEANLIAFDLADVAASMPHADWNLNYELGSAMNLAGMRHMRKVAKYCRVRARIGAYKNDWNDVLRALQTARTAGLHAAEEPLLTGYLLSSANDLIVVESISDALNTPGATPGVYQIDKLLAFARKCHTEEVPITFSLEGEKLIGLMTIDQLVAGELNPETGWFKDPLYILHIAPMFNIMGLMYFADRSVYKVYCDRHIEHLKSLEGDPEASFAFRSNWDNGDFYHGDKHLMSKIMFTGYSRMKGVFLARRAAWRTAIMGLLAYRHAITHGNQWPKRLEDLAAARTEFTDPCDANGAQLKTQILPDGSLKIWSAGLDGMDDGGPLEKDRKAYDQTIRLRLPLSAQQPEPEASE